jgi:hypothetical protein
MRSKQSAAEVQAVILVTNQRVLTADSVDHRYQAVGGFVLGNKRIHHIIRVLWNLILAGKHDDWSFRPEALHLGGNVMPIHLGHAVVDDYRSKSASGCDLQALSSGGGSEHRKSTPLKQSSLVTQDAVIVVDAQNGSAPWIIGYHLELPTLLMIDDVGRPNLVNFAH